tara:strand:+ start:16 stop:192 length:177 start_codon:yes stop_codon:yes gene_type:complete
MSENFEIEIRHHGKTYIVKRPNWDVDFEDVYEDVKSVLKAAGFGELVNQIEEDQNKDE